MNPGNLLAKTYLNWLTESVSAEKLDDDVTELTTPFLDRHNDHLQIYAERTAVDRYLLSDDGYVIADLKSAGVEPYGSRRAEIIRELLSGHGVSLNSGELHVEASKDNLGQRMHSLVQAMLSLDDMFVLAQPRVATVFLDDVSKFLDMHDVRYSTHVKFAGRSGFDHLIDFLIPRSKKAPERIVQVVPNPRRDRIDSLLFTATDVRAARPHDVSYHAVLNDTKKQVQPDVMAALEAYNISAQPWSKKEELLEELAA